MKFDKTALAILLVALATACSQEITVKAGDVSIGVERLAYFDEGRMNWQDDGPRPLTTTIWYPAAGNAEMSEMLIPRKRPVFSGGWASRGAPIKDASKKRPLIIMSHGTGGSAYQLMWLGRRLAAAGYIAAAVDHHGNTAAEDAYDPRGFRLFWERAEDLSRVVDHLILDPRFGSVIDEGKIGAVGFSLGGYTVVAIAGGRIDLDQLDRFCSSPERDATCDPQSEYPDIVSEFEALRNSVRVTESMARHGRSFKDTRIRAIVSLAPALGMAFTTDSLSKIEIPVRLVVGDSDNIAPGKTNAQVITDNITGAQLTILEGGPGHYVFLNTCTKRGMRYVPICKDAEGVDRSSIHELVSRIVVDHFRSAFAAP